MYLFFQGGTEFNFGTSRGALPPGPPSVYGPELNLISRGPKQVNIDNKCFKFN